MRLKISCPLGRVGSIPSPGTNSLFAFVFIVVLVVLPSSARSESYFSFIAGPSASFRQDLKVREFNQEGNRIRQEVLKSQTYLRFKIGSKLTYFFSRKFGLEGEHFFGQVLAGMDTTKDGVC